MYAPDTTAPEQGSRRGLGHSLTRLTDTAVFMPRLAFNVLRHGMLPSGHATVATLVQEGTADLHWKAIGDALVRLAQHSGPVLTKIGQMLATRNDLLPEAVCLRLEALYTRQRPMATRQLRSVLARAFPDGLPFEGFQQLPLAVGSIGQAHRAELPSGERVIVKIVRPNIAREIDRELNAVDLLLGIVLQMPGYGTKASRRAIARAVDQLSMAIRSEVDLRKEAAALADFAGRFRTNPRVRIPAVYRQWSSRDVLVMEELEGEPLSAFRARAKDDPAAAKRIANLAIREILSQIFEAGRFHADPHAGNLLVLPDGRLGLIDLGLTGESDEQDRRRIANAVRAFVSGDPDQLTRALLDFGTPPTDFDHETFQHDVIAVVRRHEAGVVAQVTGTKDSGGPGASGNRLEQFVNDLFIVAYTHDIYVPPSATLLIKTLVTIEGVARSLHPDINLVGAAIPIVLRSLAPRWLRWTFWTR
jgi:ubiquinone biosynthesis protein